MQRDPYFDSLKFFTIFAVILGHVFENFKESDKTIYAIYVFLYSFHMPLFAFISGYFVKKFDIKKINSSALTLIETYLICQIGWQLFHVVAYNATFSYIEIITPRLTLWYLVSLILWKYIAYLVVPNFNRNAVIAFVFLLAIGIGFLPFVNREFSLSRTFVFLPFFLLGSYFTEKNINWIRNQSKILSACIVIISILAFFFLVKDYNILNSVFHASTSYFAFETSPFTIAVLRTIFLTLGLILSYTFLNLCPSKKSLAKYGEQTIVLFIYHSFIVYEILPQIYKRVGIEYSITVLSLIAVVITLILCIFSRFSISRILLNPISFISSKISI